MTTKIYTMNPKACSVIELYGILDPITRDWTDGLLSNIFREINKPTEKKEKKYILFDGDVDALWIENMNSVMDDNRLLTLANGERIRLLKHCALLMEVRLEGPPLSEEFALPLPSLTCAVTAVFYTPISAYPPSPYQFSLAHCAGWVRGGQKYGEGGMPKFSRG